MFSFFDAEPGISPDRMFSFPVARFTFPLPRRAAAAATVLSRLGGGEKPVPGPVRSAQGGTASTKRDASASEEGDRIVKEERDWCLPANKKTS